VFRAVLEPENRGLAYLRLGARELWLLLLNVAGGILAALLIVAVCIAGFIVGVALWIGLQAAHVQPIWLGLAEVPVALGAILALLWIGARLSLAGPMTFAEKEFRLFESWSLTKGAGWKLLGLAVLLTLVMFAVVLIVEGLVIGGALATIGAPGVNGSSWRAFFAQPPEAIVHALTPWAVMTAVVGALVSGAIFAIALAPWAEAYRQISGGRGGGAAPAAAPPHAPSEGGHGAPADQHHAPPPAAAGHGGHDGAHGHGDGHGHGGHDDGHGHGHGHGGH
jgi:hypothetical protein